MSYSIYYKKILTNQNLFRIQKYLASLIWVRPIGLTPWEDACRWLRETHRMFLKPFSWIVLVLYYLKDYIIILMFLLQEVIPNVFLGPYSAANCSKLQSLLDHGITHIICIRHTLEANLIKPNFPDKFEYVNCIIC